MLKLNNALRSSNAIKAGIVLVVFGCFALISLNVYQYMHLTPVIVRDRASIVRAFNIIATAQAFDEAVQDAERGQRGYIITGDPVYLEPYRAGTREAPGLFSKLAQLTSSNPAQKSRIRILKQEIDLRLAQLKQVMDVRQRSGFEAARQAMLSNHGFDSMRTATTMISGSVAAEENVLARQLAQNVSDEETVAIVAKVGGALTVAVMGVGLIIIWVTLRERNRQRHALELTNAMLMQAQKMETLGQLAGGIAHDFVNMLAVIRSGINLLRREPPAQSAAVERIINGIEDGTDRAVSLTQHLLAFARRQPLTSTPIDLNKFLLDMRDLLRRTISGSIAIESSLAAEWWVSVDTSQFENAILNLAVNARDAMPQGGKLTISSADVHLDAAYCAVHRQLSPGTYVMIAVADNGAGMTAEIVEKAFEPFFTTKEFGKGTGLGLSQVYAFVKQSAGQIEILSQLGKGTTIRMYLPRFKSKNAGLNIAKPTSESERLPAQNA